MNLDDTNGIKILGTGSATPEVCVSNTRLSQLVDTSDDWIASRTGIKQRKIVGEHESLVSLAVRASLQAIEHANLRAIDIELIILATSTPDDLFGSASQVQAEIEATNAFAFDLTAACSGFVLGFVTAAQFLKSSSYQNALVIGADVLSEWIDWSDRKTCVLFGDGAGAVVLAKSLRNSLVGFDMKTDGTKRSHLQIVSKRKLTYLNQEFTFNKSQYEFLNMNGKEVYKFAVSQIPTLIKTCLHKNNLTTQDIDWLLLHQANERILHAVAERLDVPGNKVLKNLENYGNTSAASIPIVLDEAVRSQQIQTDDLIVISGFGAGLTWGVVILRW
uniref:3-oxoacyl-acyl-carrier-protein synthase 3 n=1 Tax=Timspurckia oligopyrenoides TaxID=708627 RepID=UPI001FCD687E|nr:3-oxoacyl-acyl-carrier-protein synthase 3 [Timspurckia oligopyrenoides]UNJ17591.1 3-oxoacyl-acyl-carrier-protein synthase 3 [Timspurckia oligopyrenoides]